MLVAAGIAIIILTIGLTLSATSAEEDGAGEEGLSVGTLNLTLLVGAGMGGAGLLMHYLGMDSEGEDSSEE